MRDRPRVICRAEALIGAPADAPGRGSERSPWITGFRAREKIGGGGKTSGCIGAARASRRASRRSSEWYLIVGRDCFVAWGLLAITIQNRHCEPTGPAEGRPEDGLREAISGIRVLLSETRRSPCQEPHEPLAISPRHPRSESYYYEIVTSQPRSITTSAQIDQRAKISGIGKARSRPQRTRHRGFRHALALKRGLRIASRAAAPRRAQTGDRRARHGFCR